MRITFLQQWFNLSDPGAEEALHESVSMCRFVGIDLGREPVLDETTILKFRPLLEKHHPGQKLFQEVHRHREAWGVKVSKGTIVDATIINAPSSTKVSHTVALPAVGPVATAFHVHDATVLPDLLHGEETRVWGDSAYQGQTDVLRPHAPRHKTSRTAALGTRAS